MAIIGFSSDSVVYPINNFGIDYGYTGSSVTGNFQIKYANNAGTIANIATGGWPLQATNINVRYSDGTSFQTQGYLDTITHNGTDTSLNYRINPFFNGITAGTGAGTIDIRMDQGGYVVWNNWAQVPLPLLSLAERIKQTIRRRIAPEIFTHAKPLGFTTDIREVRARETLHRVIGDEKYKTFLRKGFISVQAKSGLTYQIFPGHDFTKVYDRGMMVDRYCVILSGNFPPTDSLIMRYLLILNNEDLFKSKAVKHGVIAFVPQEVETQPQQSLLEVFKELKKAA